ncbi:hypothetical protein BDV96DRAFT_642416 [Lophiotrema nucula]|uniref:Uncharacterized protein n=1 Tax=Lophiotrema nucula TaxID=690887 RepID=A0A6A5ZIG6_9PLEO|nr:hypothetical protein BDV96DRAFT_642416 [Lophiotrema nucula]
MATWSAAEVSTTTSSLLDHAGYDTTDRKIPDTNMTTSGTNAPAIAFDCLIPQIAAVPDDCDDLCATLSGEAGQLVQINPLQILEFELGTCGMGIVNLSPCVVRFEDRGNLGAFCNTMVQQCIANGNDAISTVEGTPPAQYALYGLNAPPAYSPPASC